MKRKLLIIICIIIIVLLIVFSIILVNNAKIKTQKLELEKQINEITSHYNKYVSTSKEAKLYKLEDTEHVEFGKINSNVNIILDDVIINEETVYFKISGLDLYIYYEDVTPVEEFSYDNRYKNYIFFNKNIITNEITTFYDKDDNYLFTINDSFEFKVIVNSDDMYGVEYNDQLLFIKSEDVNKVYDVNNGQTNKSRIRTLTYHYIYNQDLNTCDQAICQSFNQFEEHLKYIADNNYFTLSLYELELYLDGKINIPEKSVVITIDDGSVFDEGATDLLEKYNTRATMFVITGRYKDLSKFQSKNLDLESHTDNMHNSGQCAGYGSQGGGILCLPEDEVLADLKLSQEKLGGSKYFAYPFFDFSDRAISLLKQAGFKLAFIGQYNTDGYSYPNKTDKYKVPRKTIFSDTSMSEFVSYLS